MNNIPLKRHIAIQPLSREHHSSLLLCWKIRTGLTKSIEPERIKSYTDWFYKIHVLPHFELEEKYIFPILGDKNELIKKALSEHRRLKRLFENQSDIVKSLSFIEEELEKHIRFEERILFNKIQEAATEEELKVIESVHTNKNFKEDWKDLFWEDSN